MTAINRTVRDPFLGVDVQISDDLVDRLNGRYAVGPTLPNGEPEFGWREMPKIPIQIEASVEIARLRSALAEANKRATEYSARYASEKILTDSKNAEIVQLQGQRDFARDQAKGLASDLVAWHKHGRLSDWRRRMTKLEEIHEAHERDERAAVVCEIDGGALLPKFIEMHAHRDALLKMVGELAAALKPFADLMIVVVGERNQQTKQPDVKTLGTTQFWKSDIALHQWPTLGDLRRAKAAYDSAVAGEKET